MNRSLDRRFWLWHAGLPLCGALLLLFCFERGHWDTAVTDRFFDFSRKKFPLRTSWFFEEFAHDGIKWGIVAFGLSIGALWLASWRFATLSPRRRAFGYLFLCLLLAPLVVGGIKAASKQHCPWDVDRYGGLAPYVRLLEPAIPGLDRGACWPSGHASGPFAFYALYFLWRGRSPRLAWLAFSLVTLLGLAIGFGRVVQGAHFVSHMFWSAIFCWYVCLLLYAAFRARL